MTEPLETAVLVLSVCLVAALAVLCWLWRSRRRLVRSVAEHRARNDQLERYLEQVLGEVRHLSEHRIPALVSSLWNGQPGEAPGLLHRELENTLCDDVLSSILQSFSSVAAQAAERAEEAAQAAVKTVTRSMQALLNEQQGAILEMLQRHDDERVLADANAIDHASSQLVRRAQVIGVLTGSWPGRQRDVSPLLQVVRGGVSRIRDYQRVKISGDPPFAVTSRAVEPVVLAVAELLDNAARHSQPGADVHVWFVQGHNGVTIVIDDAGVGLKPEDRETAARLLSGDQPVLLTQLRNPPQFGWAVVGVLARRYGFRASVEKESDFGGVRASVYLPNDLLVPHSEPTAGRSTDRGTTDRDAGRETAGRDARRAAGPATSAAEAPSPATPPAGTAHVERPAAEPSPAGTEPAAQQAVEYVNGLPQRRRRRVRPHTGTSAPRMQAPQGASRVVGAFLRGRGAAQHQRNDERKSDR